MDTRCSNGKSQPRVHASASHYQSACAYVCAKLVLLFTGLVLLCRLVQVSVYVLQWVVIGPHKGSVSAI